MQNAHTSLLSKFTRVIEGMNAETILRKIFGPLSEENDSFGEDHLSGAHPIAAEPGSARTLSDES